MEENFYMILSEDRISHISHKICDRLYLDELVDYTDEDEALRVIKKSLTDVLHIWDEADTLVFEKIRTLKKGVQQGTPEWDVLHRKYMHEELLKKGY